MADSSDIGVVLGVLAERRGVDFRDHHRDHVERGVRARMSILAIASVNDYLARLAVEPEELSRLTSALVVPVTSFFRDPPVFAALGGVLRATRESARSRSPFRAWSIGTATGEEAWSIAAILADELGPDGYEVLATDLDPAALAVARRGVYGRDATSAIVERHRSFFETTADGGLAVGAVLRSRVRFVEHDLVGPLLAPPEAIVAAFGLVVFRNVLIYLDERLQKKAIDRVASVLAPGGLLVLGSVESVPADARASFEPHPATDPSTRILRRR